MIHLAFDEYTLCGRHIDTLRYHEGLECVKKGSPDYHDLIYNFKRLSGSCGLCMHELHEEEMLVVENTSGDFDEDPVI